MFIKAHHSDVDRLKKCIKQVGFIGFPLKQWREIRFMVSVLTNRFILCRIHIFILSLWPNEVDQSDHRLPINRRWNPEFPAWEIVNPMHSVYVEPKMIVLRSTEWSNEVFSSTWINGDIDIQLGREEIPKSPRSYRPVPFSLSHHIPAIPVIVWVVHVRLILLFVLHPSDRRIGTFRILDVHGVGTRRPNLK